MLKAANESRPTPSSSSLSHARIVLREGAVTVGAGSFMQTVRIDKWLWAVRVFKTRSLAAAACRAGHVKLGGESVKAAREVRAGELITAYNGHFTRTLKVVGLIDQRVGAQLAADAFEELTPESERLRKSEPDFTRVNLAGKTKPSKKERRQLDRFKEQL